MISQDLTQTQENKKKTEGHRSDITRRSVLFHATHIALLSFRSVRAGDLYNKKKSGASRLWRTKTARSSKLLLRAFNNANGV